MTGFNTKVTPEIENLTQMCVDHSSMDVSLYGKYDVKRLSLIHISEPTRH